MHEYSIIQALVDSVETFANRYEGGSVRHLYVQIGDLAGVDRDLLQTAYETFRIGTICEAAPITIERVAARWECPRCHAVFPQGATLRCTVCAEPATLAAGDEILLRRIEMEVS